MSRLNKKLESWASQGLITQVQANSIAAYEDSLPRTNWTMIGVSLLAIGTVCLGIISLIAYNWHLISDAIKLTAGFSILFVTAGFIVRSSTKNYSKLVHDGLVAFFILFCFAMIGLIAQIYNLKGDDYKTGLLWSAMTLLVVSSASHFLIPYFWTSIFMLSLAVGCWQWPPLKESLDSRFSLFLFLSGFLAVVLRSFFRGALLQKSIEGVVLFLFVFASFIMSYGVFGEYNATITLAKIWPHFLLVALIAFTMHFEPSIKRSHKTMGLLILSILAFNTWLEIYSPGMRTLQAVMGIICFVAWAIIFFAADQRKLYHLMFVLTAIKIFEIFVREANSLISAGVGLISAGAIVMLTAYAWNSKKDILERRLQEYIK
ncbi:DUF2157 domain-containing protein [Bdellovibrio sp. HCB274]|uniref:DUF2157 domain-containing protein n=1 Tax=Bdellovibrio sp. HCB274 TaxID=3394361 RepID=UPI0039B53D65